MKLSYKAVGQDGKQLQGIIEAKSKQEAVSYLRTNNFTPIDIIEKNEAGILGSFPLLHRVSSNDLVFFTRQLASMIVSGLTLIQSLHILRDQVQNPEMKETISGIILDVEEGKTLSSALERHPRIFFPIYISLIKAAESSGLMDKVLVRLADNLEEREKLKSTVKSALTYPIIVVIGMILVMGVMMIFVIPQLNSLYESLNIELPITTKIVIGISNFVANFWPLVLGVIGLSIFLFNRWHKTESGRLIMDDLILKMPVVGKLIKESILVEFTRTFGLLVGTGNLVVDALNQSASVAGNIIYKNAIENVAHRVEKGITIGDAMNAYPLFPPILVQMVRIGEQTGKLDESLTKVSEYFEREVNLTVKTLTTAIEPIIMVFLGIGVGFLIISIITPIYNLVSSFS